MSERFYIVKDGLRYSPDFKICYGGDNCRIREANIVEGTEEIVDFAFRYFKELEVVTLPSTLKKIGKFSFNGCLRLKSFRVPSGVDVVSFGMLAECESLEQVILPISLTEIEEYAFYRCKNLEKLVLSPEIWKLPATAVAECDKHHIWSDILSVSYPKEDNDIEVTCTFEKYLREDLKEFITYIKEALEGVVSPTEIAEKIEDEVYNLNFN